jgi:biopolymer transport protein ExbD
MSNEEQQAGQGAPIGDQGPPLDPWYAKKKEGRGKKRRDFAQGGLAITSLMDALTIVLCFLLSTYASEPVSIQQNEKLRIAYSNTQQSIQGAAKIEIQADAIYCNDVRTASLREENGVRTVDEKAKAGGKNSFLIDELKSALEEYTRKLEEVEKLRKGQGYDTKSWVLIVADIATPIRVIKEVLFTAKEAGYDRYMFAVIRSITE